MDDSPSHNVKYTYFRASVHISNVLYYLKAAVAYRDMPITIIEIYNLVEAYGVCISPHSYALWDTFVNSA